MQASDVKVANTQIRSRVVTVAREAVEIVALLSHPDGPLNSEFF